MAIGIAGSPLTRSRRQFRRGLSFLSLRARLRLRARVSRAASPAALQAPGERVCIACGKDVDPREPAVELDGVSFHTQCSIYRRWGESAERGLEVQARAPEAPG